MTCIVAVKQKNMVYIGGDSAGVAGIDLRIRTDEKVFEKGSMLFGFTSSFRMGQVIRYCLSIPEQKTSQDDYEYLCSDFIDSLIKCFKDKEYAEVEKSVVSGGTFLIGYKGNIYKISSDFQVGMVADSFDACGCGERYALGALHAIRKQKLTATQQIQVALEAAEKFSGDVSSPFNVICK